MNGLDNVVFGGKKFSDILEEIYNNQKKKDKQISALISELKPLVNEIGDATLIVPLNSSKITSSILEPVSINAVEIIVKDPPSSMFLAAPKNLFGLCNAFASTGKTTFG